MVCEDTLRIKNLPKELSDAEKEDFLRHFAAVKVKIITSKAKHKSVAFAKFESKEMAKAVLLRLHQLTILNCRLCVEYAESDIGSAPSKTHSVADASADSGEYFQQFLRKLNSWNTYSFHQPPPPHLKYSYPRPNRATLSNIAHALASVPKFYTQVLHLMNKMNLPPPFSDISDNDLTQSMLKRSFAAAEVNTSGESEIESEEENVKAQNVIPAKRKMRQKKSVKRPKFIKPNLQIPSSKESDKVENVFEKVILQQPPKIQLKLITELPEEKVDILNNATENGHSADKNVLPEKIEVITKEELEKGRMSSEELSTLPVFKGYQPGPPAAKLYIKNIAKAVEVTDLEYIYKRYIKSEGMEDQFNIKLMKEGRMKGQAFITFNTVESAHQALEETNGYVLKEKPLVVMFAKSASQSNS